MFKNRLVLFFFGCWLPFMLCSCLKIVSCWAFWLLVSMCASFMFKNHILVCFLVGGLHLCFVMFRNSLYGLFLLAGYSCM